MAFLGKDELLDSGRLGRAEQLTEGKTMAQELQDISFPRIESGLRGEGLTSEIRGQSIRDMLAATREEYLETQRELPGVLTRTIPKADVGVRDFIRKSIGASFARTQQGIKESDIGKSFEERGIAQNLAFGALSTEKGIANRITEMFNQNMLERSQSPTFESELFGGLGGALGTLIGGRKTPTTTTTAQAPQIGGASVFTPAGASLLSDQFLGPQTSAVNYSRGHSESP